MKIKKLFCISLLSCFLLTGCDNRDIKINLQEFNLNFRYFLLPNTQSNESIKVNAIDLTKEKISLEEVENVNQIISKLFDTCANYDFYTNHFENINAFYEPIQDYFDENKIDSILEENALKKSIDNMYAKENVSYQSAKVISINKENGKKYYEIEVVCVNNEMPFLLEYLKVYLNDENKITQISLLDDLQTFDNTTKIIDKESLINDKTHMSFYNVYSNLTESLTNASLYEKYYLANSNEILLTDEKHDVTQDEIDSKEYLNEMDMQVNTLISNVNTNLNLDTKVLKQFFVASEGNFKNSYITSYELNDFDGLAYSHYIVECVSNGSLYTFDFTFDRVENKIVNITLK